MLARRVAVVVYLRLVDSNMPRPDMSVDFVGMDETWQTYALPPGDAAAQLFPCSGSSEPLQLG